MGQKIHPLGLRLGVSQPHRAKWCMKPRNYPYCILEDRRLRQAVIEIATERLEEARNPTTSYKAQGKKTGLGKTLPKQSSLGGNTRGGSTRGGSTRGGSTRGGSTRGGSVKKATGAALKQKGRNPNDTKPTPSDANGRKKVSTLAKDQNTDKKVGQKPKNPLNINKPKAKAKVTTKTKPLKRPSVLSNKLKPKAVVQTMFHTSMFRAALREELEISDIFVHRRRTLHHYKTGEALDVVEIYVHTRIPVQLIHGTDKKSFIKSVIDFQKALEKVAQTMRPAEAPRLRVLLNVFQVLGPEKKADFIAARLVARLEKREPFRQALRATLKEVEEIIVDGVSIPNPDPIDGIKMQVSGRLNGAEIARTEWLRRGSVPLQTLRADLGYSYQTAKTTYGILGIKIWTFKKAKN